jgi:hypothetical protein
MRMLISIAAVLTLSVSARAEMLKVDDALLNDSSNLIAMNTQASTLLPAIMDMSESMASQGHGSVSPMGKQFGIGLQIGYPTAISFKYMLTGDQGLQGGVGFFGYGAGGRFNDFYAYGFAFHLDYLWHAAVLAAPPPFVLSFYIGIGGQLGIGAYGGPFYVGGVYTGVYAFSLAARVPFGVSFAFTQIPIELFLEITPTVIVFPPLGFTFAPSLGFRFYF